MHTLVKLIITVSFVTALVAFWNRNNIPQGIEYLSELAEEPRQKLTRKRAFDAEYEGISYLVTPEFDYELYGMVVSYRHHDGESTMHKLSNDHLNVADLCVVWGDNLDAEMLGNLEFWNGIFTCNVSTGDSEVWSRFQMNQLSNNHLISSDDNVRNAIADVSIGDQIRISGWLASYTSDNGASRGTSTTRTDQGNGACETIYVERFEIISEPFRPWRVTLWSALAALVVSLIVYFALPYRVAR